MVDDNWNVFVHDPILFEILSENGALFDAHLSNTVGGVGEVTHENGLEMFTIALFSENDSKFGDEFEHSHSNSPLAIFSHVTKSGQKLSVKEFLSDNVSNFN